MNVTITPVNDAPVFVTGPTVMGTATVGGTLNVSSTTSDVDGNPVTVSYQWRANGVNIPGATTPSFVLTQAQAHAVIDVYAVADDGQGQPNSQVAAVSNALTVANSLPTVAPFMPVTMAEGSTQVVQAAGNDVDGDPYTFATLAPLPPFASLNPLTGVIQLAPGFVDAGAYLIDVYAIDPYGAGAASTLSVTVTNVNQPPVIASPLDPYSFNVNEDTYASFQVVASDPDGDPYSFSISTLPLNGYAWVTPAGVVNYIGNPNFNNAAVPDSFVVS
ncbi:MAG: hypothetical protein D6688_00910, partial [Alphaproteobacteria bacterium]